MEADANSLLEAEKWAATTLIQETYRIFRVVTVLPPHDAYQPIPKKGLLCGFDYYAVFHFDEEAKKVRFRGLWPPFVVFPDKTNRYPNVNLWLDRRRDKLPEISRPMETTQETKRPKRISPFPDQPPQRVPPLFDFRVDFESKIPDAEKAIRLRAAAFQRNLEFPDMVAFLALSPPSMAKFNKLSWQVGLKSKRPRTDWLAKELDLLEWRLTNCTEQTKFELYQQLVKREVRLRLPYTGQQWTCKEGMKECKEDEIDRALLLMMTNPDGKVIETVYCEMPFEDAPGEAFKSHEILLVKGQAYLPIRFLKDCIRIAFIRFFKSQPLDRGVPGDKRLRELITQWDRAVHAPSLTSTAVAAGVPTSVVSIDQLHKPACISTALQQYPDLANRKLLSNYVAQLGLPASLLFKRWAAPIERKYGRETKASNDKRHEIEREVKQWHKSSQKTDFHSCDRLLREGKCPYFKPGGGMRPEDAFQQCWQKFNKLSPQSRTPAAFTLSSF